MNKNNNLKKYSLANVIVGYIMMSAFILLILLNQAVVEPEVIDIVEEDPDSLFTPIPEEEVVVTPTPTGDRFLGHPIVIDRGVGVYNDRLTGVILENDLEPHVAVIGGRDNIYVDNDRNVDIIRDEDLVFNRVGGSGIHRDHTVVGGDGTGNYDHHSTRVRPGRIDHDRVVVDDDIDLGLLDRRLADIDRDVDIDREIDINEKRKIGIDTKPDVDLGRLTLARGDDDVELGDIEDLDIEFGEKASGSYGVGKSGQLYAYNFPSRGVGAGIGNSAVGAGAGGGAGLGAGIGQGLSDGDTVPTLGGVGTYSSVPVVTPGTGDDTDGDGLSVAAEAALGTDPNKPDSDGDGYVDGAEIAAGYSPRDARSNPGKPGTESSPALGGVGGLVGGAGAGGAAGLVTGMVTKKMGIGIGPGCAEHGGDCTGQHGHGGHANYDHLPKDGALHIMMHVDGSGSILNTRKQLDLMKETLLKTALLPYYNNDEGLYNRRVTIVSSSGERTLKFFTEAAKKDNVLAIAFQDEAQPSYHLPTFNKKPQDHYSADLGKLKASLNGYGGVYRGVMFQVDRGKTFAKSFKEFVESAFRGEGYLQSSNLKKYYRDNNNHHIKNKDGIVFSDEYHAKDAGDPQYYLDLIFNASKKVGLDLDIYGAGLKDGRYNKKTD